MPRLTTRKRGLAESQSKSKQSTHNLKRRRILKAKCKSKTKQKNKSKSKSKITLKLKLPPKHKKSTYSNIEPLSPELSEDDEGLFDENQEESELSDVTSTSDYEESAESGKLRGIKIEEDDKQGKKRCSRRDFRSCFNNFFKQTNCVPHPSSLRIDADSEIRLQKQRQMIELGRKTEEDENSDNLSDLSDCLEIYDESDKSLAIKRGESYTRKSQKDPEQVKKTLSEVPTGLEPVDHLIRLAKEMDDTATSTDLFELERGSRTEVNASLDKSLADYSSDDLSLNSGNQQHEETFDSSSFNRNSSDCDLISPTSSFKLLADETSQPEFASCYPLELPQYNKPSMIPETSIRISDYLKIDVPSDDSSISLGRRRHNLVFPYRYNSDNLNLACLDNVDEQMCEPRHARALNKRALFYGNSEAMVSDGRPITLKDFLN